jgi:hypothetical protein
MNLAPFRNPTLIITGVVYGTLGTIAKLAGILGIWLGILLALSLWRYCYEVLRRFAQGRSELPPPDIESMNPVGELLLVLHFFAFPGLIFATTPYQPVGTLVAIFVAFVFPASAALMGITRDLTASLNPVAIARFIGIFGRDYIKLVFAYLGISFLAMFIDGVVISQLGFFSLIFSMMLEVWALLVVFALIGEVVHQRRLELDIPGELRSQEDFDQSVREREWKSVLDRAYASIRGGLIEAGYLTLRQFLEHNNNSAESQYWLFENMLEWENKRYALEVAARLIEDQVEQDRPASALELYQRCRRFDSEFSLSRPIAERIAHYAHSIGQHGVASELEHRSGNTTGAMHQ